MKKYLVFGLAAVFFLAACNKKAFLKKIQNTWKMDTYLFDGQNRTVYFDTTFRDYQLNLTDDDFYSISYKQYFFSPDSAILVDTLGYDSTAMDWVLDYDTLRFIDTTIVPYFETGTWNLLNSEEDLQLRNDSTNTPAIYRILDLDGKNLKLKKGNEEFYFTN